jgi:hypothetical protein
MAGWDVVEIFEDVATDTHAFGMHNGHSIIISFRGTTGKQNWMTNLKYSPVRVFFLLLVVVVRRGSAARLTHSLILALALTHHQTEPFPTLKGAKVHNGFNTAFLSVFAKIRAFIVQARATNPHMSLYVRMLSQRCGLPRELSAADAIVCMQVPGRAFAGRSAGQPAAGLPLHAQQHLHRRRR